MDEGVTQVAEVVDVHDRAEHHKAVLADENTPGTGMQVYPLVQVNVRPQVDVVRESQAYPVLNSGDTLHLQDQAV